jgi:hypothetical protein
VQKTQNTKRQTTAYQESTGSQHSTALSLNGWSPTMPIGTTKETAVRPSTSASQKKLLFAPQLTFRLPTLSGTISFPSFEHFDLATRFFGLRT